MHYKLKGSIGSGTLVAPLNTRVENGYVIGNAHPADLGTQLNPITESSWKEMPHVALANISTYGEKTTLVTTPGPGLQIDPKSVEQFVRTYGGFRDAYLFDNKPEVNFKQEIAQVAKHQESLRRIWCFHGNGSPPNHPASQLPSLQTIQADMLRGHGLNIGLELASVLRSDSRLNPSSWDMLHVKAELGWDLVGRNPFTIETFTGRLNDETHLSTSDLWTLIRFLFIYDFVAKKTGICGNPGCRKPYYLKKRKDQLFCESGCSEYAQRQYSLRWWRENRQGKRAKKRRKSPRKKKK